MQRWPKDEMRLRPIDAYRTSMGRATNLFEASRALNALGPVLNVRERATSLDDLFRGAVVLGVSAMDSYVHHTFSARLVPFLTHNPGALAVGQPLYSYLRSIRVPASRLVMPAAAAGRRPLATLRAAVDRRLFLTPLQRMDEIEKALAGLGLPNAIVDVAADIGVLPRTLRSRITRVVSRRNAIAHQGDLFRGRRRRFVSRPITENEIGNWLSSVDQFVTRLDAYVAARPP